jgi:competence protein ComEA
MSLLRQISIFFCIFGFATSIFAAEVNSPAKTNKTTQAEIIPAKVNINTATLKDLMRLKGLNRAKAKSILAYRQKHGSFKSLDDIKFVKGFKKISSDQLKIIQDQLAL